MLAQVGAGFSGETIGHDAERGKPDGTALLFEPRTVTLHATMSEPVTPPPTRRWIRSPLPVIALFVVLGAFLSQPLLRDASTRLPAPGVELVRPWLYVALAPLSNIFDNWSLLDLPQHIALLATVLVGVVAFRIRAMRSGTSAKREMAAAAAVIGGIALFVVTGALLPRPMARLMVADSSIVRVDFHSHTSASHDGRWGFNVEANRRWHRNGGFDVAYITDHATFAAAEEGEKANPPRATDGTTLLSGLEVRSMAEHLNYLGMHAIDTVLLHERERLPRGTAMRSTGRPPLVLQTIPIHEYAQVIHLRDDSVARLDAIEINDAAPKGLAQLERDRAHILALSDSLRLTRVAGSDNHGWGRTAVAWTLIQIPGWRALAPDSLGSAIERTVRDAPQFVRVVERFSPAHGDSPLQLAMTAPLLLWRMFATLTLGERISWIAWLAVLGFAARRREVQAIR